MAVHTGILYVHRDCGKCEEVIEFCEGLSKHGIMEYSLVYVGDPRMRRYITEELGDVNLPYFVGDDGKLVGRSIIDRYIHPLSDEDVR